MSFPDLMTPTPRSVPNGKGGFVEEPCVLGMALPIEQYLSAIIAHELSNPFTALVGRVDLMRSRKDATASVARDLEAMKSANERIDRILVNLKSFARREGPPPRPVELRPLLQGAIELFRKTPAGARVDVTLAPADCALRALADPVQVETVLAATLEALAQRSMLVKRIELKGILSTGDEEIAVVIQDDGPLIPEEEAARVFHPFGGPAFANWAGSITLAYGYYIIRSWGGTYRFRAEGRDNVTEMILTAHM